MNASQDAAIDEDYPEEQIREILRDCKTIAMVGASANWNRPSYFAMKYLLAKGYNVIPVNPGQAGNEILGQKVYSNLHEIDQPIDMVDCFRAAEAIPLIADDAIAIGAKVLWLQLGVRHDAAAKKARNAGLIVVMNRCPKIEYGRLSGEIGWMGFNTGIISARRTRRI
jgi:predicted CoA-binding protein